MKHPDTSRTTLIYYETTGQKSIPKNTTSVALPVRPNLVTEFKSAPFSMKIYTISMTLLELENFDFLPPQFATKK